MIQPACRASIPGQDGVDAVIDTGDIHVKEPLPLLARDLGDQAGVADSGRC